MRLRVGPQMTAAFFGSPVHPLYATFALIEHCEYAARQAIRPYLEPGEDAVGAAVAIEHTAATPVGWTVEIVATVVEVRLPMIICEVRASNRLGPIASGRQQQRVVSAARLRAKIDELTNRY